MSAGQEQSEDDYVEYLEHERHMYAWCLRVHGGFSEVDAAREADEAYRYEPASQAYRWLKFHDEAWHWAMLRIHRSLYWHARPELRMPSSEYRQESERFESARGR